jgi:2-(1,2-epoxy-1,2-dihydrophenyl)acetyl-CoA isomerase
MYEHLLISNPADSIRLITLNRPRQFNALAKITFTELTSAIDEFEKSQDSILILTGTGRAFCFGADFQEFQNRSQLPELLQVFQNLILRIFNCEKITIAALNGFATGAGLDLALACDFRLASDRAKLGEAYISMGLVSDGGGSFFLSKMLGSTQALQLLMTGDSIEASRAYELGLVSAVHNADQLQNESIAFAQKLASKPQTALRLLKKLVKQNDIVNLEAALRNERDAQLKCFEDPVHQSLLTEFINRKAKKITGE